MPDEVEDSLRIISMCLRDYEFDEAWYLMRLNPQNNQYTMAPDFHGQRKPRVEKDLS